MKNLFSPQVPILFVGPPGVGKTADVTSSFDHVEVFLTSTLTEEDIGGLPYRDGNYDYRTVPAMFRRLVEADKQGKTTALFLDELDKARRSVADTLLTLVASRKVGDGVLPKKTCIIAAANPPQYGGGDGISDAMISRFSVVQYIPSPSRWATWARKMFKGANAERIISAIESGRIPIIDMAGDGLDRRITSPRTIALALSFMQENPKSEHHEDVLRGLLTANAASLFMSHYEQNVSEEMATAIEVKMKAGEKFIKPIVF